MYLLCGAPPGRTLRDAFGKTLYAYETMWLEVKSLLSSPSESAGENMNTRKCTPPGRGVLRKTYWLPVPVFVCMSTHVLPQRPDKFVCA